MPFILEHNDDGIACPRFQCDKCEKPITNARGVLLLWNTKTHRNDIVTPLIVCKSCDRPYLDYPYSMELESALIYLLNNCKMTEEWIKRARENAGLMASIK